MKKTNTAFTMKEAMAMVPYFVSAIFGKQESRTALEQLVHDRAPIIAAIVSTKTGMNVSDVPVIVETLDGNTDMAVRCSTTRLLRNFGHIQYRKPETSEEECVLLDSSIPNKVKGKKPLQRYVDLLIATALLRLVDARKDEKIFTDSFTLILNNGEIKYTAYRAAEMLREVYGDSANFGVMLMMSKAELLEYRKAGYLPAYRPVGTDKVQEASIGSLLSATVNI